MDNIYYLLKKRSSDQGGRTMEKNSKNADISEEIKHFRKQIDRYNLLNKKLQITEDFEELEKLWSDYSQRHGWEIPFWRGADVQVLLSRSGETEKDWRKAATLRRGYGVDEPCPSRYPEMLSGLLLQLGEGTPYIDHNQRYEFYFNIHKTCVRSEMLSVSASRVQVCSRVIFEQIRLLNSWVQELIVEMHAAPSKNLIQLGWKYYFAYGRNVNRATMLSAERCPDAIGGIQACLNDHRFAIDQRHVATVIPEKGRSASGILWMINPHDEAQLDLREGVNVNPQCYRKERVIVKVSQADMFGMPEEVEALVYISNFSEGDTPRTGYIQEIIEGLTEGLYSGSVLETYRKYLPKNPVTTVEVIKNNKPDLLSTSSNFLLKNEFLEIIKKVVEEEFGRTEGINAKDVCFKIFECLNTCFRRHSPADSSDPKALSEFLLDFIHPDGFEALSKSTCFHEMSQLVPLITSDNILFDNRIYPDRPVLVEQSKFIEDAQSSHKQFNSEYAKTSQNFTRSKMKRLIRKLSSLLWTVRSNMVHGSKLGGSEDYRNRGEIVSQLTLKILFEILNSLFAGGLKNLSVYGELRSEQALHSQYMRKFTFCGKGSLIGLEWRDVNNQRWMEIGAGDSKVDAELYRVNELNSFEFLDVLEASAKRVLTQFEAGGDTQFSWSYSKKKDLNEANLLPANNYEQVATDIFNKSDALALMYCTRQLSKKFEQTTHDKYEVSTEISFDIDGFQFESSEQSKIALISDELHNIKGLKFKHAAELKKHFELLKHIFNKELFPNRSFWPEIEKGLFGYFFDEVERIANTWPHVLTDLEDADSYQMCRDLVVWFYEAVYGRANALSETYIESSLLKDWGKEADDLFCDLAELKDL